MREVRGDLWELAPEMGAVCITTNGDVKKNGEAVMGRGCALEAAQRFPLLPVLLGEHLQFDGNHVGVFMNEDLENMPKHDYDLVTFPVKHHWRQRASLELILRSAKELVELADPNNLGWTSVLLPRPGCGNGGLSWHIVGSALARVLDDRFTVITNEHHAFRYSS